MARTTIYSFLRCGHQDTHSHFCTSIHQRTSTNVNILLSTLASIALFTYWVARRSQSFIIASVVLQQTPTFYARLWQALLLFDDFLYPFRIQFADMDRNLEHIVGLPKSIRPRIRPKDEYGREVNPPLPVTFKGATKDHKITSNFVLFTLPDEVKSIILGYMDNSSLAALARVDRDCRQLARTRQFSSILLDYSYNSLQLLQKLLKEAIQVLRLENSGLTAQPTIGACIRRIIISTNPERLSQHHNIEESVGYYLLDEKVKMMRWKDAATGYYDGYLKAIKTLFKSPFALPHLKLVYWGDAVVLSPDLFKCFAKSNSEVEHLTLCQLQISEEFEIEPRDSLNLWRLKSLRLSVNWDHEQREGSSSSPFCSSLLRQCAPSLETLVWIRSQRSSHHNHLQSFGTHVLSTPRFPKLRKLHLYDIMFSDSSIPDALLEPPLTSLTIRTSRGSQLEESLSKRGCIRQLKTFVWEVLPPSTNDEGTDDDHLSDHVLTFLRENTELSRFALRYGPDGTAVLEQKLLPLLSKSFRSLTSLSLEWRENNIPESALEIISTLKSLNQIFLSAGRNPRPKKSSWFINHDKIKEYLAKLPHLQKVGFSRDWHGGPLFNAYIPKWRPDNFPFNSPHSSPELRRKCLFWEEIHASGIMWDAMDYIAVLPNLEWIFLGGHPIKVKTTWGMRASFDEFDQPSYHERDSCVSYLRRIFAGEGEGEGVTWKIR